MLGQTNRHYSYTTNTQSVLLTHLCFGPDVISFPVLSQISSQAPVSLAITSSLH